MLHYLTGPCAAGGLRDVCIDPAGGPAKTAHPRSDATGEAGKGVGDFRTTFLASNSADNTAVHAARAQNRDGVLIRKSVTEKKSEADGQAPEGSSGNAKRKIDETAVSRSDAMETDPHNDDGIGLGPEAKSNGARDETIGPGHPASVSQAIHRTTPKNPTVDAPLGSAEHQTVAFDEPGALARSLRYEASPSEHRNTPDAFGGIPVEDRKAFTDDIADDQDDRVSLHSVRIAAENSSNRTSARRDLLLSTSDLVAVNMSRQKEAKGHAGENTRLTGGQQFDESVKNSHVPNHPHVLSSDHVAVSVVLRSQQSMQIATPASPVRETASQSFVKPVTVDRTHRQTTHQFVVSGAVRGDESKAEVQQGAEPAAERIKPTGSGSASLAPDRPIPTGSRSAYPQFSHPGVGSKPEIGNDHVYQANISGAKKIFHNDVMPRIEPRAPWTSPQVAEPRTTETHVISNQDFEVSISANPRSTREADRSFIPETPRYPGSLQASPAGKLPADSAPSHPVVSETSGKFRTAELASELPSALSNAGNETQAAFRNGAEPTSAPRLPLAQMSDVARFVSHQVSAAIHASQKNNVEIMLNPVELGKVRISLSQGDAGLSVAIHADRPETLDLMRRHSEFLAQEFRNIGYSGTAFSFGQSGAQLNREERASQTEHQLAGEPGSGAEPDVSAKNLPIVSDGRVDIRL